MSVKMETETDRIIKIKQQRDTKCEPKQTRVLEATKDAGFNMPGSRTVLQHQSRMSPPPPHETTNQAAVWREN